MDLLWVSSLFNLVKHANFEVAYTRREIDFYGSMIYSNDGSCLLLDLPSDLATVLVYWSYIYY